MVKMISAVDGIEYKLDEIIVLLDYIVGVLKEVHENEYIRVKPLL